MKIWVALAVFIAFFSQSLTKIARINQYAIEARAAYSQKDFATAIYLYQYLTDSLQVRDRSVKINLAHAYFQQNNMRQAWKHYQPLLTKTPARITSLINLQLGVMIAPEDKTQALSYFKKALLLNPLNEDARYNYELLKKYLVLHPEEDQTALPPPRPDQSKIEKPKQKEVAPTTGNKENPTGSTRDEIPDPDIADSQNPPQANSNQTNSEGSETDQQDKEEIAKTNNQLQKENSSMLPGTQRGVREEVKDKTNRNPEKGGREESDERDRNTQTTYERLREANITPEKAKMLLEAMREAEVQYLQQIPRKSTRKSDPSKPNW